MIEDSLKKRYVLKLLANIVFGITNALLVAIVPKALGPVAYGQFNFLQQLYNQFISLVDANSSTAFFTKLSANNSRKELIAFYFFCSLLLFIVIFIASFAINQIGAGDVAFPDVDKSHIYLSMIFCFFTWLSQIYIKISDAYAVTVPVEIIKIVHKIVMLIMIFIIINGYGLNLENYLFFNIISLVILLLVLQFLLTQKKIVDLKVFSQPINFQGVFKEFYSFCSPLFFFNLIAIAIGIFDIWLLQKISGSVEVGFYGLAYSISAMCFLFTSAMTPIIMREFSKSIEKKDFENVRDLFRRYVPMLYAISAYFSVFVAFHAADLLLIFTDQRYEGAYMALVIMAFYPLHQTYGQINAALFFSAEKVTLYRNIGLLFSFFGLILSFLSVYLLNLGAEGMAWKMLIVQLVSVNVQLYYNAKYLKESSLGYILHQILCVMILGSIAYLTCVSFFDSLVYDFLLSGFLYTAIVLLFILRFPTLLIVARR